MSYTKAGFATLHAPTGDIMVPAIWANGQIEITCPISFSEVK